MMRLSADETWKTIPSLTYNVTEKCNLSCCYCNPAGDGILPSQIFAKPAGFLRNCLSPDLSYRILREAIHAGLTTFRLTGGEPLIAFPQLQHIMFELNKLPNRADLRIRLNTNGVLLSRHAKDLLPLQLQCIKVSLDSLSSAKFRELTNHDKLGEVEAGIREAVALSLPVEINMVLSKDNTDSFWALLQFCIDQRIQVLKVLDLYLLTDSKYWSEHYEDLISFTKSLEKRFGLPHEAQLSNRRGTPMLSFSVSECTSVLVKDSKNLGVIYSSRICPDCPFFPCQNGMLTVTLDCNGLIAPCRFRPDLAVDIPQMLSGVSDKDELEVIRSVIAQMLGPFESMFLNNEWNGEDFLERALSRTSQRNPFRS